MRRQRHRGRLWPYVDIWMRVIRERTSEGEQCLLCLRELCLQLRDVGLEGFRLFQRSLLHLWVLRQRAYALTKK